MSEPKQENSAQAALIQLGFLALQTLIREAPAAIVKIQALLATANPTPEDFDKAIAEVQADTVASLVPNAAKFPAPPA